MDFDPLLPFCPTGSAWGPYPEIPNQGNLVQNGSAMIEENQPQTTVIETPPVELLPMEAQTFGPPNKISDWDEFRKILHPTLKGFEPSDFTFPCL